MSWQTNFQGTYFGSVFAHNTFAGPEPAWAVAEARLHEAGVLLATLPCDVPPAPSALPQGSWVPYRSNPVFTGRDAELRAIAAAIRGAPSAWAGGPICLSGIGGVGKTQIAAGGRAGARGVLQHAMPIDKSVSGS